MLDPISALNVASAVITFLEFSGNVLGTAREVYRSTDHTISEHVELSKVTKDLQEICRELDSVSIADNSTWSPEEQKLQEMAKTCAAVAKELRDVLDKVNKQKVTRFKSWSALRIAVRGLWSSKAIDKLREKLDFMRSALMVDLLYAMRAQNSSFYKSLRELLSSTQDIQSTLPKEIKKAKEDIQSSLQDLLTKQSTANLEPSRLGILASLRILEEKLTAAGIKKTRDFTTLHTVADSERLVAADPFNLISLDTFIEQLDKPQDLARVVDELEFKLAGDTLYAINDAKVPPGVKGPAFEETKTDLRRALQSLRSIIRASRGRDVGFLAALEDSGDVDSQVTNDVSSQLKQLNLNVSALLEKSGVLSRTQCVLDSLYFAEMQMRHVQIPKAYSNTNSWILQSKESHFRSWLEHSSGIFWINGKAGSGKSTMIKFMADSPETHKILQRWAGIQEDVVDGKSSRLAVVSYFFWHAGHSMQKSMTGLLQSLVYHIFRQCPEMIPLACATRFKETCAFPAPWSLEELWTTLESVLAIPQWSSKFCFFIDGLDEYDATTADQSSLVDSLNTLCSSTNIKICVSSRPWNVFRSAYDHDKSRRIVLQDHNKADLDAYIAGKLEADRRFQRLAAKDPKAPAFALDIREKAQGVFLWVFLVVRSLLDGLTEEDDVQMLQKRLDDMPPTLEKYFDRMLGSIDPVYKQYTSRALLLACASDGPLPTLAYYYLTAELNEPEYAIKAPIKKCTKDEMEQRHKSVVAWINKWCRDLLEVPRGDFAKHGVHSQGRVEFIHRTAKEFLVEQGIQERFRIDAGSNFNICLSLCRSYLAQAKETMTADNSAPAAGEFYVLAGYVMFHAREYESHRSRTPYAILEELDRVGCETNRSFSRGHWTSECYGFALEDQDDRLGPNTRDSDFTTYAIENGLQLYVSKILSERTEPLGSLDGGYVSTLMRYATHPTLQHPTLPAQRGRSDAMMALLMSYAIGHNAYHSGATRQDIDERERLMREVIPSTTISSGNLGRRHAASPGSAVMRTKPMRFATARSQNTHVIPLRGAPAPLSPIGDSQGTERPQFLGLDANFEFLPEELKPLDGYDDDTDFSGSDSDDSEFGVE